jgi:TIR domain
MPQKIFISYRREDTAANALGIGQYLENEFGRKNVFIDIDMRAGTKFPVVLEQRLAECKVMLVLIGPDWLNSRDGQGQRRLDNPDDWVRLEIAHALKRNITVIPVRVNGVGLPEKTRLSEEIRGLLDHQAVSVSTSSFRSDMAGLAKDIRSIPSPWPWRRLGAIAAGVLLPLVALALAYEFGFPNLTEHPKTETSNGIWSSRPGEWVMFATDLVPVAYFYKPSSVRTFDNKIVYTSRRPQQSNGTARERLL